MTDEISRTGQDRPELSKTEHSKTEQNRKENKAALKKFIPLLIVCAIIGGIIGGVSAFVGHSRFSGDVAQMAWHAVNIVSPWAVIILGIGSYVSCMVINRKARKQYGRALAEAGEGGEPDEDVIEAVEKSISWGITIVSVMMIVQMLFFGMLMADLEYFATHSHILMIATLVIFVAGNLAQTRQQQLLVDLEKEMNPSKTGSVYDSKFHAKWEESCDELEKMMIYKSAYKAYRTTSLACVIMWVITATLSVAFKTGPLPSVAVTVIWLVMTVSYSMEAMKLEKGGKK